jgi:predicted TIM-barrel fold metal-dependent hydrolase
LGEDKNAIYFDTSAVLNPEIYEAALESLDWTRILFGSDMPILLWHGKRKWTETEYINLCREDFSWNKHIEERKKEDHYTFFLYEQINNILNALQKKGAGDKEKQGLFSDNALKAFRIEV